MLDCNDYNIMNEVRDNETGELDIIKSKVIACVEDLTLST
jgi:hypothetical protein